MDNISYVALSAQIALRNQIDVVANNVANVNTQGFRAESLRFREFVENTGSGKINKISFTDDIGRLHDTTIGALEHTDNPLDLAINGQGFFAIQTDKGLAYTRHGKFTLNDQSVLTTTAGHRVLDEGGATITIPIEAGPIEVNKSGEITNDTGQVFGKVQVASFAPDAKLVNTADNLYVTNALPQPTAEPNIIGGTLEGSNVQPVKEITKLITAHHTHTKIQSLISRESDRQIQLMRALGGQQ